MPNPCKRRSPGATRQRPASSPLWIISAAISCLVWPALGQLTRTPLYELPDPGISAQTEVGQGFSVAVDGNLAAVSTPSDHTGMSQAGVVKIYDATTGALRLTLTNPTPAFYDHFGHSVAISGSRVVVGAIYDDTSDGDAGSAYVYDLSSPTPTLPVLTLTNPSPAPNSYFGKSVGISGSRVVVGAIPSQTGGNAYVYDLSSASPTAPVLTLTNPGPYFFASFGSSVAISGQRIAVGALENSVGGPSTGNVYVYDLASPVPAIPILTLNNPAPDEFDYFGQAVAISGTRLIVGAPQDDTGALNTGRAYIYDLTTSNPSSPVVQLNNPSPGTDDYFGYSVAISDSRVVVGAYWDDTGANDAGRAYVYDLSRPSPTVPVATLNNPSPAREDRFGWSVAIGGMRVVVGAIWDDTAATDTGLAYAYDLASLNPDSPVATLNHPTPSSDRYGASVALSGTRAIVGAPNDNTGAQVAGSAHIYDLTGATPTVPVATLTNPSPNAFDVFGSVVAISGTRAVVGAYRDDTPYLDAGRAYVYDLAGASPAVPTVTLSGVSADREFGVSVAISGTRVVAASSQTSLNISNAGAAYVFDLASPTPAVPVTTLNYSVPSNYSRQNFRIATAISGTRVVIGTAWEQLNASAGGLAQVYDVAGATPTTPVLTLTNPSPAALDRFGLPVAISGSWVVVAAPGDDTGAPDAGSVYVYDLAGANPLVPVTLNNPSPVILDSFGISVAVSETHLVVGASNDDTGGIDAGIAYVYALERDKPLSRSPLFVLNKLGSVAGEHFGLSVGLDGARVVVGAPDVNAPVAYRGAAYIFGLEPGLHIVPVPPDLVSISWAPTNSPGYVLQYKDALEPDGWLNAASGASNPTTVRATNASAFYRLFKP